MGDYNLSKGEYVVMQEPSVTLNEQGSEELLDEIVLTNKTLILVNTVQQGLFKRSTMLKRCPLDQLQTVDDTPQVHVTKLKNSYWLQAPFASEVVMLRFANNSKRTATRWAQSIQQAAMGNLAGVKADDPIPKEFSGVADAAAGIIDLFQGDKKAAPPARSTTAKPAATSAKCPGCHAPVTGKQGGIVTCAYCDTTFTL